MFNALKFKQSLSVPGVYGNVLLSWICHPGDWLVSSTGQTPLWLVSLAARHATLGAKRSQGMTIHNWPSGHWSHWTADDLVWESCVRQSHWRVVIIIIHPTDPSDHHCVTPQLTCVHPVVSRDSVCSSVLCLSVSPLVCIGRCGACVFWHITLCICFFMFHITNKACTSTYHSVSNQTMVKQSKSQNLLKF